MEASSYSNKIFMMKIVSIKKATIQTISLSYKCHCSTFIHNLCKEKKNRDKTKKMKKKNLLTQHMTTPVFLPWQPFPIDWSPFPWMQNINNIIHNKDLGQSSLNRGFTVLDSRILRIPNWLMWKEKGWGGGFYWGYIEWNAVNCQFKKRQPIQVQLHV